MEKLLYECSNGHKREICFSNFLSGYGCRECKNISMKGKNNINYNPNLTDEDRKDRRTNYEYIEWRKLIHKKFNYTCQICGQKWGKLCAHHIESYRTNEDLRFLVSNGFLMCRKHHILFHKIYGFGNNDKNQLNEFLVIYKCPSI